MLPELGQIALILALLISIVQATLPMLGAHRGIESWMAIARPAAYSQLLLVGFAFVILTQAFVAQDFSLRYVAENSNTLLPMAYRYSAVWGAHEGSLLLWATGPDFWSQYQDMARGAITGRITNVPSAEQPMLVILVQLAYYYFSTAVVLVSVPLIMFSGLGISDAVKRSLGASLWN
ncbi:hypothetical protein AB4084_18285, partial [Lysobacter sp. 2RAB21]